MDLEKSEETLKNTRRVKNRVWVASSHIWG